MERAPRQWRAKAEDRHRQKQAQGVGGSAGGRAGGSADDAPRHLEAGMTQNRERALHPEDIARLFVARVNSGDLEGVLELFEPYAVVAYPVDRSSQGTAALRELYAGLLAARPQFP